MTEGLRPPHSEGTPNGHQKGLVGEALKASLVITDVARSQDALHGVEISPLQQFVENGTVGPYYAGSDTDTYDSPDGNGHFDTKKVAGFLSDPNQVVIVACGRDEHRRGNLLPNLTYAQRSTHGHGNVLYIDANSTDGSAGKAREIGVDTIKRSDVLADVVDTKTLAEILAIPEDILKGQEIPGYPPLRKGIDIFLARIAMLQRYPWLEGIPQYMMYMDTDLKSIPGGSVAKGLPESQIYYPAQLLTAGLLDLQGRRTDGRGQLAVLTGSENRNNETIFGYNNRFHAQAVSPYLSDEQRQIALAFGIVKGGLVHPLTGELIVNTMSELNAMGATGQCVETARTISLAGQELHARKRFDSEGLRDAIPMVGNVRRGTQQRVDEPQTDAKESWMIQGVIPLFAEVVTEHALRTSTVPQYFNLDDYAEMNRWLARINVASRLDNARQTRTVDSFPMERVIPPVTLLHTAGLLNTGWPS